MPTIPWVESECGHYGSLFGAIGASGVRIALSHSSGSATTAGSHSPKLLSLAKAFTRVSRKIGKPLEAEASPVRQAWEGMPLIRPSLQSH